jgi:hypothetical protein
MTRQWLTLQFRSSIYLEGGVSGLLAFTHDTAIVVASVAVRTIHGTRWMVALSSPAAWLISISAIAAAMMSDFRFRR